MKCISFTFIAFLAISFASHLTAQSPQPAVPQPAVTRPAATATTVASAIPELTTFQIPECVAEVNGEKISKSQLAAEVIRQFGQEMLKDEIKKRLILIECQRRQIVVTPEEITEEIRRLAESCGRDTERLFQLLEKENGMSRSEYVDDVIRPMLGMIKIAGQMITVSDEALQKEFDARFGPSVQVRQIVFRSQQKAEETWQQLLANPDSFPSVAKNLSEDPTTKPYGGQLPPLRYQAISSKEVADTIFALKPGEISRVVQYPVGEFVIYRCEQHFPRVEGIDFAAYRPQLEQKIRNREIRKVSEEVFSDLMKRAQINDVMNNPQLAAQYPQVAAVVNGNTITRQELIDKCLRRYGKLMLNDIISKKVIEQECRHQNIQLTHGDLDNEIREMAAKSLPLKQDGTPDVERWLTLATQEAGVSLELYRANTIWPMLALKRLSKESVQVTEEDVRKGFEANFGPKVRCRVIILDNQRRALEVWNKATQNPTIENFADLAEKFSVDESRLAGGAIPPIQRHGGQPAIEKEAFSLQPGEISQIVQDGEYSIFLFCEGHTPPVNVKPEEVKTEIVADIYEKKLKIAIARRYEEMLNRAVIDNFLDGVSTGPRSNELPSATAQPSLQQDRR